MSLLLALFVLLQGIPAEQGGTVTGILRDGQGKPLPGVRIAAVARGDPLEAVANGVSMAGLAETDEQGRFTLENVPAGRYSIAAGRLDLQTYYPGTQALADARILTITPGVTISSINFALNDSSSGRSSTGFLSVMQIAATIPVRVVVENGGKVPVNAYGKSVFIQLQSSSISTSIPIDSGAFTVPGPITGDFRVVVGNLPDTYEVKSITYGNTDITHGTFQLSASNFPTVPSVTQVITSTFNGTLPVFVSSIGIPLKPATTMPSGLAITLGTVTRSSSGVRVSGRIGRAENATFYLSGKPGITFSDRTFEFLGVQPGRHVIGNNYGRRGIVVVVGNNDLDGIELKETPLLPSDIQEPKDPLPAGPYSPGAIVPLAHINGTVLNEETGMPISEGSLWVRNGTHSLPIPIDANGRFETFDLLPGTYTFRLEVFGHSTRDKTVTIDDKNISVELTTRALK